MNGGERACFRIADQNWDAVSSLYCKQDVRRGADERITVLVVAEDAGSWHCFFFSLNDAHIGAVNLPAAGQRPVAVEELEKAAAVLVNVFGIVFIEAGEIQRVLRHGTDAAESR